MFFVLRVPMLTGIAGVILACGLLGACNDSPNERPFTPTDAGPDADAAKPALDGAQPTSDALATADSGVADSFAYYECPVGTPTCTAPARTYAEVQPILAQCVTCHEGMNDYGSVRQARQNMIAVLQGCNMKPNTLTEWQVLLNWFACGAPADGAMPSTGDASSEGSTPTADATVPDGSADASGTVADGAPDSDVAFVDSSLDDGSGDGASATPDGSDSAVNEGGVTTDATTE